MKNHNNDARTVVLLNRLLVMEARSLAMYLADAHPWLHPGGEGASGVVGQMVRDQQYMVDRIASAVFDYGGSPEMGAYPLLYANWNDLSIDYMLQLLVRQQKQIIAAIERLVEELRFAPPAKALAEEALGMAKGHLESLEETQTLVVCP